MGSAEQFAPLKHTPRLVLLEATPSDIPEISSVYFRCFSEPVLLQMIPQTPTVKKWWDDANLHDLLHRDSDRYIVVKDEAAGDKVVGYAKWQIPTADKASKDEFFPRFPPWAEESDKELCDLFFEHISKDRVEYFDKRGLKQHAYLDMLGTIPEYRKNGVGGMLVEWGCKIADEQGVVAYVDASDMGGPVYKRFGFVPLPPSPVPGAGFSCLSYAREPKAKIA